MAKTLLNATNEIFKGVSLVAGDANLLTTLTDSSRQVDIDQAVQAVNEVTDELYTICEIPAQSQQKESTITLATGTRAYSLATDLTRLRWPMIDKTNTQFLFEYPEGYNGLLILDPEQDDTGLPHYAAVRETDGKLHMDRAPASTENGKVYTYQYDKDTVVSAASDQVPFSDDVFRALVPAWAQVWRRGRRNEFDDTLYKVSFGRAARMMSQSEPSDTWYRP